MSDDIQQWSISGAKKEGGRTPVEDPDTLRSKATAKVLALFGEGPITGLVNGNKSIYLNDTPIVGNDGSSNFQDVGISFAAGTQGQSAIGGFDDVRVEQSLGLKVTRRTGPIVITTTSADLDQIYVRMGVASLFKVDKETGDVKGTSVSFRITIRDALGSTIAQQDRTISGKSRGSYETEYQFGVSGTGPWTVKVERTTGDAQNVQTNDDLYFKAIVGVLSETLRYPNSALMGITVSSEFFQSVPTIAAELYGIKIKVPSNYNSSEGTYSGIWDGSFKTAYSNNPVWVFYDLLTNTRYGCGEFINEEDIDVYSLLPIAQYCDERVSDGRGGTEKRLEFNAYINNRAEAYEVINALAAAFRGMTYYAQGMIIATQDRPASVVKQFSAANVVVETDDNGNLTTPAFTYEGTGLKARKTVALVSWNDKNDRYKGKVEYVEDREAIERYGYRELEVRGFGCTSQSQAQRIGRWALLTNINETETVTFKVAAEGFFLMPGEIIEIADSYKTAGISAGSLSAAGTNAVVLDREVSLEEGKTYEIIIRTIEGLDLTATVTTGAGSTNNISFSPSFTEEPELPAAWIIREAGVEPRRYRVIGLNEDDGIVTVLASAYYEEKFSIVDETTTLSSQTTSIAGLTVSPVVNAGSIILQIT